MGLRLVGVCGVWGVRGVVGVCVKRGVFSVSSESSDRLEEAADNTGDGNSEPGSGSKGINFIIRVRLMGTGAESCALIFGGVDSGEEADVWGEMVPSDTCGDAASEDGGEGEGGGEPSIVPETDEGEARMDKSGITSGEDARGDGGAARDSDSREVEFFVPSHARGQSSRGTRDSKGERPMDACRSLGSESRESCFSSSTSL